MAKNSAFVQITTFDDSPLVRQIFDNFDLDIRSDLAPTVYTHWDVLTTTLKANEATFFLLDNLILAFYNSPFKFDYLATLYIWHTYNPAFDGTYYLGRKIQK